MENLSVLAYIISCGVFLVATIKFIIWTIAVGLFPIIGWFILGIALAGLGGYWEHTK